MAVVGGEGGVALCAHASRVVLEREQLAGHVGCSIRSSTSPTPCSRIQPAMLASGVPAKMKGRATASAAKNFDGTTMPGELGRKLPTWKSAASRRRWMCCFVGERRETDVGVVGTRPPPSARAGSSRYRRRRRAISFPARARHARASCEQAREVVRSRHAARVEQADLRVAEQLAPDLRVWLGGCFGLRERPRRQRLARGAPP